MSEKRFEWKNCEDKVNGNKLFTFSYHLGFIACTFFSFKKKHCFDLCILIRTTCGKFCFYRSELIKTRTRRGAVFLFASKAQNRILSQFFNCSWKSDIETKSNQENRKTGFVSLGSMLYDSICSDFECFVGSSDPLRMWFLSNKHN